MFSARAISKIESVASSMDFHASPLITSRAKQSSKDRLLEVRSELLCAPGVADFVARARKERGLFGMAFFLTTFAAGILIAGASARLGEIPGSFGAFLLIMSLSAASAMAHESWHGHLSTYGALNDWISRWILSPLLVSDFQVQRRNHMLHHAHLGEKRDPDGHIYRMSAVAFSKMAVSRLLILPYLLKLSGIHREASSTGPAEVMLPTKLSVLRVAIVHSFWVGALVCITVLFDSGLAGVVWALACGYAVPLLVASVVIAFRGHREHYAAPGVDYVITYDTVCGTGERWLIAGGYFNLHACHHLFPDIPQQHLPRLLLVLRNHGGILSHYGALGSAIERRKNYFTSCSK